MDWNLSNSIRSWLMQMLELGPGLGQVRYLTKVNSAYYSWLRDDLRVNPDVIHFTLADAYANVTGSRNDVIAVTPGAYDEAASLDWAKSNTHLIGLGGPNTRADYSEANTVIYTDTTSIDYTVHLTGNHSIFRNIGINNAGANAANYGPLYVNGYGNTFRNVGLIGNMTSQQLADDDCASLHIGTLAHNCKWINCDIGEDCWGARSAAYSGQVSFIGSNPNGGLFKDCFFRSAAQTATVAMITTYKGAAGTTHIGRAWVFDNCKFSNFDERSTVGTNCNEVFHIKAAGASWPVLLHNCSQYGYDRWSDQGTYHIKGTMPVADDGGGQSIQLDETVAGSG